MLRKKKQKKPNNNNNNINDKWAGLVSEIEKHLVCSCLLLSDALIEQHWLHIM